MKIAIHNSFHGGQLAEAELSRRLILAATNLGWEAIEVGSSDDIWRYHPDFVLSLHFKTPKLTSFPTYGCLWHPAVLIETDEQFTRNILSYDVFLTSSPQTDQWLADRLYNTPKKYFTAPFFTSCNTTVYQKPDLQNLRLMYVGSNWDGARFQDLFLGLDPQQCLSVYGSKVGWSYLNYSYKGTLPFDGISVLKVLNQVGAGLCLHRDEHTREGIPSMRIFEIAASGAIAICGDHSFIRQAFADTVLYVDTRLSTLDQVAQITDHLRWIAAHPQVALEMSRAAHQIFVEQFSLEHLLSKLQAQHQSLLSQKGFGSYVSLSQDLVKTNAVQLILLVRDRNLSNLQRSLESIKQQTYQNFSILLMRDQSFDDCDALIEHYAGHFLIQVIKGKFLFRSSDLWCGIQVVSASYFGVLESGAVIFPNHLHTLVSLLDSCKDLGIAYAEGIQSRPGDRSVTALNSHDVIDPKILKSAVLPDWADLLPFDHPLNINGFLARSSLLDSWLKQDPGLETLEDLFLLLNLAVRGRAMFSYEATYETGVEVKDPVLATEAMRRIEVMMRDREFPSGQTILNLKQLRQQLHQSQTELTQAQQRIVAMESSKFWQLRQRWFQLKRKLGLNTKNE